MRVEHFSELGGLPPGCREVVEALEPTLFLFSPTDNGNDSWLTREQMVAMLRNLEPITDSSDIFKTVLNDEDKMALTDDALFSHCLPLRRNIKATDAVMDADYCVAVDEAENRLHVQKAVMMTLLGAAHAKRAGTDEE